MTPDHRKAPVALWAQGGCEWIAGRIYVSNLVRALALLPETERVPFHLVVPHNATAGELVELGGARPARFFAFRDLDSDREKLRMAARSLARLRTPRSLEALLVRTRARVFFPSLTPLGGDFPIPWIGWIPDFQHKRLPQFFSEQKRRGLDDGFQRITENAAHVVVSSQDARNDLMRWFPTDPERVTALPFTSVAANEWYAEDPAAVAARFALPEKFLIFPSQFWIHKNHRVACEAISILRDRGIADIFLVSTGHKADFRYPEYFADLQQFIEQRGLNTHIRILGLLPRTDQIHLLRRAAAVIQPSLFEGWSSLVEDSRTLGKRIYVSDIPVHREQQPFDATFFDPANAEQLADLIAADWPSLKPGPDPAREQEARAQMEVRAAVFAKNFLQIVDRATETKWSGRPLSGSLVKSVTRKAAKRTLRSMSFPLYEQAREQMEFNRLGRKPPELMWEACARCPRIRTEAFAAVIGQRLFLMGGYKAIDVVWDIVDVFDFHKMRWTDRFPMPPGMAQTHLGIVADEQRFIYVVGGQHGAQCSPSVADSRVLDTANNTWSTLPPLPEARYSVVLHLWRGRLHAVAGSLPDRATPASDHWSIAVKDGQALEKTWRDEVPLPEGGPHRGSALLGDALYVLGGNQGDVRPVAGDPLCACDWDTPLEGTLSESFMLEPGASQWTPIAPMPEARGHTENSCVTIGPCSLVVGGNSERFKYQDIIQCYDSRTGLWKAVGHLPYGMKTSAVYHEGWLYTFTGQRTVSRENLFPGAVLNSVWRAKLDPAQL